MYVGSLQAEPHYYRPHEYVAPDAGDDRTESRRVEQCCLVPPLDLSQAAREALRVASEGYNRVLRQAQARTARRQATSSGSSPSSSSSSAAPAAVPKALGQVPWPPAQAVEHRRELFLPAEDTLVNLRRGPLGMTSYHPLLS